MNILHIWFAYILFDAIANWYIIEKKKINPAHSVLFVGRCAIAIIYGGFVLDLQPGNFIPFAAFTGGSFWILFDMLLNVFRSKNLFYIGENASTDKFGLSNPIIFWTLKVIALAAAVWGYWWLLT